MTNLLIKIRHIYLPFLLIGVAFILGYSFLNWLFIIRLDVINADEEVINIWLPFILVWVPIFILLDPRIKLLRLKSKRDNLPFLYRFVAAVAISIPAIVAQHYLPLATGKLTKLANIAEIAGKPNTMFYQIKTHYVDKGVPGIHFRSETSGKNNESLTFYIDVVCAITDTPAGPGVALLQKIKIFADKKPLVVVNNKALDSTEGLEHINPADVSEARIMLPDSAVRVFGAAAKDGAILITLKSKEGLPGKLSASQIPKAWLGMEFKKSISNNLTDAEKNKEYKSFLTEANSEFANKKPDDFIYLTRAGNNARHKGYLRAIKEIADTKIAPIVLEAQNGSFEMRTGAKVQWFFGSFGIGALIMLIIVLIPNIDTVEFKKLQKADTAADMSSVMFLKALFNTKSDYFVTSIIAGINVLMFIIMVFAGLGFMSFDSIDLVSWGAMSRPLVLAGQWWRLLTATFLHGGFIHLLGNMYGLIFVALFLEPKLGKARYAAVYVICGIAASIASICWHPRSVGIGASGAIFGLYGVFTALIILNRADFKANIFLLINNLIFVGINLLLGLKGSADNAAHIGGLAAGLITGFVIYPFLPIRKTETQIRP